MVLNQPKPSIDRICSNLTTGLAWIEPNGTVHWLDRKSTHGQWAYFYKRPERDDGTWAPVEDTTTYNELLDAGWIRVSNILHLTVDELDTPPPAAWDAWALMMTDCRRSSDFSAEDSVVRISAGRMGMSGIDTNPAEAVDRFCSQRGKGAFWSSMMGESVVRKLVREMLLRESQSPTARAAAQGMAICTVGDPKIQAYVLVYDPKLLVRYVTDVSSDGIPVDDVVEDSIDVNPVVRSGVTIFHEYDGSCYGKGIVRKAASVPGSGMGPAAYEAAMWYADGLTSDRQETSRLAGSVWFRYKQRADAGELDALRFDDVSDPQTPPPEDDCALQDRDWLNYSYRLKSKPPGLDELEKNHKAVLPIIKKKKYPVDKLPWKLRQLFMMLFDERMSEDEI